MTIAEDVLAALRVLDKPVSAEQAWQQSGCIHARPSFNTTLADMVLNKHTLHRWKSSKGFLYGLPSWKGDNKYEKQVSLNYVPPTAAQTKEALKKQSSSAIEKEASRKAAEYVASIPAFITPKTAGTGTPKKEVFEKIHQQIEQVKAAEREREEPAPIIDSPLTVLTKATIAECQKLRDRLLKEITSREEMLVPLEEAIDALEWVATCDGII